MQKQLVCGNRCVNFLVDPNNWQASPGPVACAFPSHAPLGPLLRLPLNCLPVCHAPSMPCYPCM